MRHKAMQLVLCKLAGYKTEKSHFLSRVSEVTLGPFLVFFATIWARNWVLFCRCGCVTKPCNLCFASSLATKLKSLIFLSRVSEVTSGPFLSSFATIWARNWVLFCRCGCVTKLCSLCLAGSLETKVKSLNFIKVSIKVSILFQFYSRFQKLR